MSKHIQLPGGPIEVPDGQDPYLYLLGRITQGQEDLGRNIDILRKEVKELRDATAGRIGSVEIGLRILGTRFAAQVKSCAERLKRAEALKRPWYTALVGVIVAAAAGLIGALASLVIRGQSQ